MPPVSRVREVSARQKRWKIFSRICGGMPSPWSMTEIAAEAGRRVDLDADLDRGCRPG